MPSEPDPEEAKKITVPVLLMVGGDSPPANGGRR